MGAAIAADAQAKAIPVQTAPAAFAELDPGECKPGPQGLALSQQAVIASLLNAYPLKIDVSSFGGNQVPLPQRIAKACAETGCTPKTGAAKADAYSALNAAAGRMLSARANARFRLIWAGKGPEPHDRVAAIAAFYNLDQTGYQVQCLGGEKPAPVMAANVPESAATADRSGLPIHAEAHRKTELAAAPKHGLWGYISQWRVASSLSETEKDSYAKRDPAQLSFVDNAADSDAVLSVKAVAVTPPVVSWGHENVKTESYGDIRPFVGYERISSLSKSNEINNVDLGVRSHFRFARNDGGEAYIGSLTAAFETDDRGLSSLTRFEASVQPPWYAWLKRTVRFDATAPCVWCQTTDLTLVADYVNVANPGDKAALFDLPQYARLGFDAQWGLRLKRPRDQPTFGLDVKYSEREDFSDGQATANRLTTRAAYYPTSNSHFAFGLEYDRGQDLTSLTAVDRWMVTWGYRQ